MEDSTGCIHGSRGVAEPASEHAALGAVHRRGHREGDAAGARSTSIGTAGVDDYALVRDEIAETYPDTFHDFNAAHVDARRLSTQPLPARERKWQTKSGKAEFFVPETHRRGPGHARARPRRCA